MKAEEKIKKVRYNMVMNYNSRYSSDGLLAGVVLALEVVRMSDEMVAALKASHGFATMATDGARIYYADEFVESLSEKELLFVYAHEVYHVVLDHLSRLSSTNYHPLLWNMAGDYVINSYLKEAGVGKMPKMCLYDKKYKGWSTNNVAKDLLDEMDKKGESPEGQEGEGTGNFDQHLSEKGMSEEEKNALHKARASVESAIEAAVRQAGNKTLGEVQEWYANLHEAKVDWREELRADIEGLLKRDYSYNKVHRWTANLGGACLQTELPEPTIKVALGIDTSGSMGEEMLGDIMSEVVGITEQFRCFEFDIWCFDTSVHNHQFYDQDDAEGLMGYKLAGGGGTVFQCNWDYMKETFDEPPKKFILLTDGYDCGTIHDKDYCDTTFLVHSHPKYKAPFGRTIIYEGDL